MSTLEDLKPDMDDNMVDMTNFFERPPNEKGHLDLSKQLLLAQQLKNNAPHLKIALPTYQ